MQTGNVKQEGASINRASDNELVYTALQGCGCAVDLVWCSACANALARKAREGGPLTVDAAQAQVNFTSAMFGGVKAALQNDSNYAWSWQCNLAMAIYDESHPQCYCEILDGKEFSGHRPECAIVRAHDARHFNEHALSHAFCNNAAARFMKLCFDVDVTKSPEWESLRTGSEPRNEGETDAVSSPMASHKE